MKYNNIIHKEDSKKREGSMYLELNKSFPEITPTFKYLIHEPTKNIQFFVTNS